MGKNIFIVTLCLVLSKIALAQPAVDGFMKGKGNLDLVGGINFDTFSKYHAFNGLVPVGRSTTSASIFAAAGITNWLDAQVNLPYVMTASNWSNLQDVSLFLKARLLNKSLNKGTFSTLISGGFSTPISDYPTQGLNAIGQQATAVDARLIMQYFANSGWFGMLQGGITSRSNPTPTSAPVAAKIGKAAENYYFDIYYDFQNTEGGADYLDGTNPAFTSLGVSYHKLGGTLYKPFSSGKMGLAFGAYAVLAGRNVGQSFGGSAAFIYKMKYLKNE